MKITDKIKTFEDACKALGLAIPEGLPEILQPQNIGMVPPDVVAMLKLQIITAALNEGWQWQFGKEYAYYPWFYGYTKEEIDGMTDDYKKEIGLCLWGGDASSGPYSGLGYAYSNNAFSYSPSYIGSRLVYKSRELARYSGRQFSKLWSVFLFPDKKVLL